MTGNKIITVHSIRRGRRTHQAKRKAPKQSDDYHDGYIKHADRTAKFTRIFRTGKFGCFCLKFIGKHSRAPPSLFCANSTKFTQKGDFVKIFFESYNELVTLSVRMFFGRRCNGCDR